LILRLQLLLLIPILYAPMGTFLHALLEKHSSIFLWVSFTLGVLFLSRGFYVHPEVFKGFWFTAEDTRNVITFSVLYYAFVFLSTLFLRRYTKIFIPLIIGGIPLLMIMTACSVGSVIVPLFFIISSYASGNLLLQVVTRKAHFELSRGLQSLLEIMIGITLYMTILGIMVLLPINIPILYMALLLLPVLLNYRKVMLSLKNLSSEIEAHSSIQKIHSLLLLSLLSTILAIHAIQVSRPEMLADALGIHLLVPSYIKDNTFWNFDVTSFVFAVMPMGADWLYGLVYVLEGEYAARTLNFLFLLVTGLFVGLPAWNSRPHSANLSPWIISLILFYSSPLLFVETGSLFVDNLWACLLLSSLFSAYYFKKNNDQKMLLITSILLGGAFLIKVTSIFYALILFIYILPNLLTLLRSSFRNGSIGILISGCIFVFIAGAPYLNSFLRTGNPVFPFYNAIFKSPLYYSEKSFEQPTFKAPLQFRTLYDMTFKSDIYLEALKASLGYQFLTLFLLASLVAILVRSRLSIGLLLVSLGYFMLVNNFQAYLRYLLPSFVTFSSLISLALYFLSKNHRTLFYFICTISVGISFLHIISAPAGLWYYRSFTLLDTLMRKQEIELSHKTPERILIERINSVYGKNARILFIDANRTVSAGVQGIAYSNNWHNDFIYRTLHSLTSAQDVLSLIRELKITHIITGYESHPDPFLNEVIKTYTVKEFSQYAAGVYQLDQGLISSQIPK
jgi:hypothetical protein